MPMNRIVLISLILFNMSFAFDRCDLYGVFLDACAKFGQKHKTCDEFDKELNKVFHNSSKSSKLFIDACALACKTGAFNKSLSSFGINSFVRICKVIK